MNPLIPVQLNRGTPASPLSVWFLCAPPSHLLELHKEQVWFWSKQTHQILQERPSTKLRSSLKAQSFVGVSLMTSPVWIVSLDEMVSGRYQEKRAHSSVRREAE